MQLVAATGLAGCLGLMLPYQVIAKRAILTCCIVLHYQAQGVAVVSSARQAAAPAVPHPAVLHCCNAMSCLELALC
jgi:hypothetical protein